MARYNLTYAQNGEQKTLYTRVGTIFENHPRGWLEVPEREA